MTMSVLGWLGIRGQQVRLPIRGSAGSIPALVDVSLSKTLSPELLPVEVYTCIHVTCKVSLSTLKSALSIKWIIILLLQV